MMKPKKKPNCKLRVLHWKKIRKNQVKGTVWAEINDEDGEFAIPEEEITQAEIEDLFCVSKKVEEVKLTPEEIAAKEEEERHKAENAKINNLFDSKLAMALGIMLSRFKGTSLADVVKAVYEFDTHELSAEDVEALAKYPPTAEDIETINQCEAADERLANPELYMRYLAKVPMYSERLHALYYAVFFNDVYEELEQNVIQAGQAIEQIKNSKSLKTMLAYILNVGNWLCLGSFAADAEGFLLEHTLQEITEVTTWDKSDTVLSYIIKKIEAKRPDALHMPEELTAVAEAMNATFYMLDKDVRKLVEDYELIKALGVKVKEEPLASKAIEMFLSRVGDKPSELAAKLDGTRAEFKELLSYYLLSSKDEDEPTDVFAVFNRFNQAITKTIEDAERAKLQEEQKQLRLKEAAARDEARAAKKAAKMAARLASGKPAGPRDENHDYNRVEEEMRKIASSSTMLQSTNPLLASTMRLAMNAPLPADLDSSDFDLSPEMAALREAQEAGELTGIMEEDDTTDDEGVEMRERSCPACGRSWPAGSLTEEIDLHVDLCLQKNSANVCTIVAPRSNAPSDDIMQQQLATLIMSMRPRGD